MIIEQIKLSVFKIWIWKVNLWVGEIFPKQPETRKLRISIPIGWIKPWSKPCNSKEIQDVGFLEARTFLKANAQFSKAILEDEGDIQGQRTHPFLVWSWVYLLINYEKVITFFLPPFWHIPTHTAQNSIYNHSKIKI